MYNSILTNELSLQKQFFSQIPYAHSPSVRKLSKISTLYLGKLISNLQKIKYSLKTNDLFLAKNFILLQAQAIDELKKCVLRASIMSSQSSTILSQTTSMDFHTNDQINDEQGRD
jgi:hypothetical protein